MEATEGQSPLKMGLPLVVHVGRYREESANGVDRTIHGLVDHLSKECYEVEVWSPDRNSRQTSSVKTKNGVTVHSLPMHGRLLSALGFLPKITRDFIERRRALVQLIHLHSTFTPYNSLFHAGLSYVVSPNGGYMPPVLNGRNRWIKKLWRLWKEDALTKGANVLHAVSSLEADQLAKEFGHPQIAVIPNAVDLPLKALIRPIEGKTEMRVLFLGRLAVEQKGLDLLLQGWSSSRLHRSTWRLSLVGEDFRSGKQELALLASRLEIGDSLEMPRAVYGDQKNALFQESGVFVHTSRWEGLPFALLEALAAGLPALVTPQTNLAPEIEKYDAGWVVEGNPPAIAKGLSALADLDAATWQRKSDNARRLIMEKFSWEQSARAMASVYKDVLGQST